jgi:hypothetical protein
MTIESDGKSARQRSASIPSPRLGGFQINSFTRAAKLRDAAYAAISALILTQHKIERDSHLLTMRASAAPECFHKNKNRDDRRLPSGPMLFREREQRMPRQKAKPGRRSS